MKNILLLLLLFSFVYSGADSQWIQVNTGNGFDIFDLSFPDAQTGYICGYGGQFRKTTNGGTNWADMSFPTTQFNLNAVYFFNANKGLLASDNDTIYRTVNGTNNWSEKIYMGFRVLDFQFFDSLDGYASGLNKFAKTTNGGLNWTVSTIQSSGQIFFINRNTGWTVSYPGAGVSNILKTTDAGSNWALQFTTTDFRIFYDIFFTDANTGYTSGYRHSIYKTTNGGVNWENQSDLPGASGLYSIYFINANSGWTVGDYYSSTNTSTYFTTNGGMNWLNTNGIATGGRLNRVKINNSPVGYIAGQNNRVYRTTNAGGLTAITSETAVLKYSLSQNYPNPFNPSTNIQYSIPINSFVKLVVLDALGRKIETLVNQTQQAGDYNVQFIADKYPSGIYFCKITAEKFTSVRKMILIK